MDKAVDVNGFSRVLVALYQSAGDPLAWTEFHEALAGLGEGEGAPDLFTELANHLDIAAGLVQESEVVREEETLEIVFGPDLRVTEIQARPANVDDIAMDFEPGTRLFDDDPLVAERLQENIKRLEDSEAPYSIFVMPASSGFSVGLVLPYEGVQFRLVLVHDGEQRSVAPVLEAFSTLTPTEKKVCESLYNGNTLKQIARELNNSENTIKTHVSSIFAKIGIRSQKDLVHVLEIVGQITKARSNEAPVDEFLQQISNPKTELEIDEFYPKQVIDVGDGRSVAFREYGSPSGRPVIYLHGLYCCARMSAKQIAEINSNGLRVIALDRAGYGDSSPVTKPGEIEQAADDHVSVADHLGIETFDILTFGIGTFFAFSIAERHAHRVKTIHACAPSFGAGLDRSSARSPMQFAFALARRHPGTIEAILKLIVRWRTREEFQQNLRKMWRNSPPDLASCEDTELVDHHWFASREAIRQGMSGVANDVLTTRLSKIDPALVKARLTIWRGREDRMENSEQLRTYLSVIEDLEIKEIPDRGQMIFHQEFPAVAEAIAAATD